MKYQDIRIINLLEELRNILLKRNKEFKKTQVRKKSVITHPTVIHEQNNTIITLHQNEQFRRKILNLLQRNIKDIVEEKDITDLIIKTKNDKEIYKKLYRIFYYKWQQELLKRSTKKEILNPILIDILNKIPEIRKEIFNGNEQDTKIRSFLDFGCGDGKKTIEIAKLLHITNPKCFDINDKINSVDIRNQISHQFKYQNEKLPYKNESQDLITSLLVFHHIPNMEEIIRELHRIAASGCILIIQEHDCNSKEFAMYLDVIHALYDIVWKSVKNVEKLINEFYQDYYSNYRNKSSWINIMEYNGWEYIKEIDIYQKTEKNPQAMFFSAFKKVDILGYSRNNNNLNNINISKIQKI